jgi:hypothetical protein
MVMHAIPAGEVLDSLVFHFQSLQMDDAEVEVALFPDLALLQLHDLQLTRWAGGLASVLSRNDAVEDSGTDDFGQDLQDSQDGKSAV